jgi:hypothetical protein
MWQSGKVIGSDVDPLKYHLFQPIDDRGNVPKRGDPKFVMSRSELTEFAHCPARWLAGVEDKETDATDWGNLIDCLVLQPHQFEKRYAICPATYPGQDRKKQPVDKTWNRGATYCDDWMSERESAGIVCLKQDDYQAAKHAADLLLADKQIASLLDGAKRSVMVTADWLDKAKGIVVPFKILVDIVPTNPTDGFHNTLADLKTCRSAHPRVWPKEVFAHGYAVQAAAYLDCYEAATHEGRTGWMHVLSENIPPYQLGRRWLSSEFLEIGRMQYRDALSLYCQCLKTGVWPDYEKLACAKWERNGWSATEPESWMVQQ